MRRLFLAFAFACSAFIATESRADIVFAYTAELGESCSAGAGCFQLTEPDAPTAGGDLQRGCRNWRCDPGQYFHN